MADAAMDEKPASPKRAAPAEETVDSAQDASAPPSAPREDISRAKRARLSEETTKKRGNRMFGVMLGTLNKFKDESKAKGDGAKQRAAIEERLASKLKADREETERAAEAARNERDTRRDLHRKADERDLLDAIYTHRFAASQSVANMLCTSHTPSDASTAESSLRVPICPERPLSLAPTNADAPSSSRPPRPVYFLPAKLLDYQSAQIEKQVDAARRAVAEERRLWDDDRDKRTEVIDAVQEETGVRLQRKQRELAGSDGVREARPPIPVRRGSGSSERLARSPSAARTPPPAQDGDATMQD